VRSTGRPGDATSHAPEPEQEYCLCRPCSHEGPTAAYQPGGPQSRSVDLVADAGSGGRTFVSLEINLSARSLGDAKLLELIDTELRNGSIAPERVIFEVTETAALTSVTKARAFGEHLSEIGCRFALDDFGAGFGSFYYLKHLVFDYLKIDGEFIRDCCSNNTDQHVIRAIVDIARGMSKQTIAEFVGDDETVRLLTRLGVDYGQGYHLGMPAPLEQQLTTASQPSTTQTAQKPR